MRNRALASLSGSDLELLRPHLRVAKLTKGDLIHHQDDHAPSVYFPLEGMISTIINLKDGSAIEASMTGPGGMLDDGALGSGIALGDHLVQGDGEAFTLDVKHLHRAIQESSGVARMVLLAAELSNAYTLRSLACLNYHEVEARFCRWLLMSRYHMKSDHLQITQEFMAMMLGVQRTSVTTIAREFQGGAIIAYHRGQLSILDAAALKRGSCECHAEMVAKIDATFPSQG
jgi:CRP-like cAMP-binding protein